jgi:hypothetical protein
LPPDLGPDDRVMVIDPEGRLAALAEGAGERSGRTRLRALRVFHGDGSGEVESGDAPREV